MIYLKKGSARAVTNDEKVAHQLQDDGYDRIEGHEKLRLIVWKIIRRTLCGLAIPGAFALMLFHLSGGRDYTAFILGIFLFDVMHDLFQQ